MIILFWVFVCFLPTSAAYVSAIESRYPFKIDFILLEYNFVFLGGGTQDAANYQISYVQQHASVPDSILITVLSDQVESYSATLAQYTVLGSDVTQVGFKLTSKINTTYHSTFVVGYMTIINGYGVSVNYYDLANLVVDNTASFHGYKKNTSIYVDPSETIKSAVFIPSIRITNYASGNFVNATYSLVSNYLIILFQYPKTANIGTLTLEVYLHREQYMTTMMQQDGFHNYYYTTIVYNSIINNSSAIFGTNTNVSSSIYYLGGPTKAKLRATQKIGARVSSDNLTPDKFNSTFLIQRTNQDYNNIYIWSTNANSTEPASFTAVWFYRTACDSVSYPYLMMFQQRCYTLCPKEYYNDSQNKCNQCSKCTNIADCMYCHYSMCETDEYYVPDTKTCSKCSTINENCLTCFDTQCTSCDSGSVLTNGTCVVCDLGEYYVDIQSSTCVSCYGDYKCKNCSGDKYNCTQCTYPYKLTSSSTCLDCEYPYIFNNDTSQCNLLSFSFSMITDKTRSTEKIFLVEIMFDNNVTLVIQNYNYTFTVDGIFIQDAVITAYTDNNTIQSEIRIPSTIENQQTLKVQFVFSGTFNVLSKLEQQNDISDPIMPPQPFQDPIYPLLDMSNLQSALSAISENSGTIFSTLSVTSLSGYVVGILWNFQIASYYLFINVKKPLQLLNFLNLTTQMQNVQILPFQIPSIFSEDVTIESKNESYELYGIDLYFLRSNLDGVISLALFSLFYIILYFIFFKFQPKNIVTRFIKNRFVGRVYQNISMTFYSLVTVVAFTAAAALSSTQLDTATQFFNQLAASAGIFIVFVFSVIHPIILFRFKQHQNWDTQQCYIGFKRQKKKAELILSMFLISQMIIPAVIPLLHPMISILVIITSSICNLIFLIKIPSLKFNICIYYRILSQLSFILFNFLFAVCYAIERYFPDFDILKADALGFTFIISMGIVIALEFIQIITEIIIDCIRLVKKILLKIKVSELKHPSSQLNETPKVLKPKKTKRQSIRINNYPTEEPFPVKRLLTTKTIMFKKQMSLKTQFNCKQDSELCDSEATLKKSKSKLNIQSLTLDKLLQMKGGPEEVDTSARVPSHIMKSRQRKNVNRIMFEQKENEM